MPNRKTIKRQRIRKRLRGVWSNKEFDRYVATARSRDWGLGSNLNWRQTLFVKAYTGPAAGNATKAARMAGYRGPSTAGWNQLNNPHVQESISRALTRKLMSPDWAKDVLGDYVRASMANFVTVDRDGTPRQDMKKALRAGAIGQIKEYTEEIDIETGAVRNRKIKVKDNAAAIGLLLKFYKLIQDANVGETNRPEILPLEEVEINPADGSVAPPLGTEATSE